MHLSISRWQKSITEHLTPWLQIEDPKAISLFDRTGLTFLVVACILYFASYLQFESVPSNAYDGPWGWWQWYDQGHYYKSTVDLAYFELKASVYWFGYPMLGVPFYRLMPRHPYFIPNIILVLTMMGSFFAVCRHVMSRIEAWVVVLVATFAQGILRDGCLVIPWNTLPAYAAIFLLTYLLLFSKPTLWHFGICALVAAEAIFSRPNEIIPIAIIYFFGLFQLTGWDKIRGMGFFAIGCAVTGLITVMLNFYFYGQVGSPYMRGESTKFYLDNYVAKTYQLLCDGYFLTGNAGSPPDTQPLSALSGLLPKIQTLSILERYPIFLFAVPGAIYLWKTRGIQIAGLFLAILSTVAFYLTYSCCDNLPYFYTYGSYHYIWWALPWMFFLTYLSFRQAPFALKGRTYLITLLAPIALFFVIGFKAVPAAASDSSDNPLTVTTNYTGKTYTVKMVVTKEVNAMDVRLEFDKPPPYFGTQVDTPEKMPLTVNGKKQHNMSDFFLSQQGNIYDYSFLIHGLLLHPGDEIVVKLTNTDELVLKQASLQVISFAPGTGAGRLISSIRGSLAYGGRIVFP